jgi:hypothetical protein
VSERARKLALKRRIFFSLVVKLLEFAKLKVVRMAELVHQDVGNRLPATGSNVCKCTVKALIDDTYTRHNI